MKNKNICKFTSALVEDRLSTTAFILESDPEVIAEPAVMLKYHRLILVSLGTGKIQIDGHEYALAVGTLLFGFAGEWLSVTENHGLEYMYISFEGIRAEELFRRFEITEGTRLFLGFEGLLPFFRESLTRANERNLDLVTESVLLYTLSRLTSSERQVEDAVARVLAFVGEEFQDTTLTLEGVAAELGYNPKYLSHRFKEKMGVSFCEHLRTVRLGHAVFLIEHGVESVKNVALLSGFSDPLYFSAVFKKAVGVSPREYRNRQIK